MALHEQAKTQVMGLAAKVGSGIVGLVVAGGLMWFTPLIDRFVKPAKPLANFASEETAEPLTVTFKNLSENAKQAKWDFGDGSPLEIIAGNITEVKHKFKKPNTYKIKLTVSNVANQEDVRESLVAVGIKPQILDLSMKPVNQKTKPFTAGVKIKFEATADMDAQLQWDFGDGIYQDGQDSVVHEFSLPGKYLVKARAVIGHQKGGPTLQEVEVLPASGLQTTGGTMGQTPVSTSRPAPSTISVELAVRSIITPELLSKDRIQSVSLKGKATSSNVQEVIRSTPGYVIKSVKMEPSTLKKSANVINESVSTSEDGKTAIVKAQVTKPGQDYQFNVAVLFTEALDSKATKESTAIVTLPGTTSSMELPVGIRHEFEIKHQGQTILKLTELPIKAFEFTVDGRTFAVTCTKSGGRVSFGLRAIPSRLQQ
jgi:hypothetical protein